MNLGDEEKIKDLTTVVNFYRFLLKQPQNSQTDIAENYVATCLDRLVLYASPPGATHREIVNYRAKLMEFIKS